LVVAVGGRVTERGDGSDGGSDDDGASATTASGHVDGHETESACILRST
jgi:hypothetical protein